MTSPDPHQPGQQPRPDVPEGVDPLGVPRDGDGRDAFVMAAAVVVALLGLAFTLGWIVYHQLVGS